MTTDASVRANGARDAIAAECDSLKAMLLAKNAAYGNSALDPVRVASKASAVEQLLVRIDDKLSRLARGSASGEDVERDLAGYLVLLAVARKMETAQTEAPPIPNGATIDGVAVVPGPKASHLEACSFCGHTGPEVVKLYVGPGVSICPRCAEKCIEMALAKPTPPAPPAEVPREWWVLRVKSDEGSVYFAGWREGNRRWVGLAGTGSAVRFGSLDEARRELLMWYENARLGAHVARCRTYYAVKWGGGTTGEKVDYLASHDPGTGRSVWTSETGATRREFATREDARDVANAIPAHTRVVRVTAVRGCK